MNRLQLFAGMVLSAFLFGCASQPPQIPLELQYQQPTSVESATLVGSQEDVQVMDDFTAYVVGVDGKRLMEGRSGWNVPLKVSLGPHRVDVTFVRGAHSSFGSLFLNAVPNGAYQVKFSTDVGFNGPSTYCDFWVIDTRTGKAVSEIIRRPVSNSMGRTFVPIFVGK